MHQSISAFWSELSARFPTKEMFLNEIVLVGEFSTLENMSDQLNTA